MLIWPTKHVTSLTLSYKHGRNLVGDVSPHFSRRGDIRCHVPLTFLFRFCVWRGFKNKSDICHILCEKLFMLDSTPHIAKLMLKQSLVRYH